MIIKYAVHNDYCKLFDGTWSNKNDIQDFAEEIGEGLTHSAHIDGTDVFAICDVGGMMVQVEFSTTRNESMEVVAFVKNRENAIKLLDIQPRRKPGEDSNNDINIFDKAIARMSGV